MKTIVAANRYKPAVQLHFSQLPYLFIGKQKKPITAIYFYWFGSFALLLWLIRLVASKKGKNNGENQIRRMLSRIENRKTS